jgi:hypothetical protein
MLNQLGLIGNGQLEIGNEYIFNSYKIKKMRGW